MAKINALLISGANNHDWNRTTPFLKSVLEKSGRFSVTVTENPSETLADAEALKTYRLLFSDYNGPEWSAAAKASFEAAVLSGTGLVILHAADNSFKGWTEYEKMVGIHFHDQAGHGEFHEFKVRFVDHDHPITKGQTDFSQWDELYHRLVPMHSVPYQVLAVAFSDTAKGGTGRDEPMMVALQYGKGRVFHDLLGHVWPGDPNGAYKGASMISLENEAFQKSLLRGCEWAAGGQVSDK